MKSISKTTIAITTIASAWLTASSQVAFAQQSSTAKNPSRAAVTSPVNTPPATVETSPRGHQELIGTVVRASEVLGKDINNTVGDKVAKIDDFLLDVAGSRIVHVLVGSGGVAGIGEKRYLMPPSILRTDAASRATSVTLDKERLTGAPEFNPSRWDEYSMPDRISEVYRYYGQDPKVWLNRTETNRAAASRIELSKASQMIGSAVKNSRDEKLGSIDDLILDLESGRLVQVIVSSGGFLGIGDELSSVPPRALRYDINGKHWLLDVTKEDLAASPHFKKDQWPDLGDPTYVTGVYRAYKVEPYFGSQPRTAQDQGNSEADLSVTRKIRQEIVARDGLSLNARNVKIITVDGAVTLRGPVSSEAERRTIADIAKQYAAGNRVENQLEIKAESKKF